MKPFYSAIFIAFLLMPSAVHAAYDKPYVGDQIEYKAVYEDTFVHLARDYNLGFTELRAANPNVDPWIPGKGKKLILPTRHLLPEAPYEGVVINLPEMRLYAFVNGDEPPETYPLGIGREGLETPLGTTKIVRKKENPIWRPTERMLEEDPELEEVYYPGPDNPLGTHALYLGWPQYAIHGTNRPFGIGRRISSGCIRLYPEAITKLFEAIEIGTKVTVVDQPVKVGWIDNKLYIEAHANSEQSVEMEEFGTVKASKLQDEDMTRILKVAGKHRDRIRWAAVRKAVKERRGYPIQIAWRPKSESEETDSEDSVDLEKAKETLAEIYGDEEDKTASNDNYGDSGPYRTLNP